MGIKTGATDYIGRTSTEMKISFMGVDLSTKKVGMYSFYIPTKEPITGALTGNWLKSDYAITYVKDVTGTVDGTVTNDQADPSGEMTLAWKDDFNYIQTPTQSIGYVRDVLKGFMSGQVVTMSDGARIAMLGTAGNYKTGQKATADQLNREWGNLLKPFWGFLLVDQAFEDDINYEPKRNVNGLINASLTLMKPFMVENYALSGSGKENCKMMPAVTLKTMTADEADVNTCSSTLQVLCDAYELPNFFNAGFTQEDYSAGTIKRLSVDYIVEGDAIDVTAPATDEVACVIDAITGDITIEKYNGASWDVETGGTFDVNATIFAKKSVVASVEVDSNCFVAVKTPSGLGGIASEFVLDKTNTVKNFICIANEYDRDNQKMIVKL